ncbi:glutamine phosphoribosylpyrophosphate amidotransferase [Cenarchaeum symbiosum A]|uniref:Amidophosphoribosyltransferase n=1 Tax=Cenarchaeum symbiosum (strain A) TaxID=414004 RepID=A0RYV2_CENSY|nr:glutamine phosphoribosylpyrophosphate amidotransferase [Cenarchaeum symbiosum A]
MYSLAGTNVIPMAIDALRALQHRGQEAWGLAVPGMPPLKKLGLVSQSASEFKKIAEKYSSKCAIGHVRYSTVGKSSLENAQPLKVADLCIAHNGTIANADELAGMVGGCTFTPQNSSDTMIAASRLVSLISEKGRMGEALAVLKDEMAGSYCFTFMSDDGSVHAARDPKGFRPMVLGHKEADNLYMVASESAALSAVGAKLERDVRPGELIKFGPDGMESEMFAKEKERAHCSFEFTYFAHPSSKMEGSNVYIARKQIGRFLAKKFPIKDADLVIPVPDSARPAALGYAQELGIPFDEGLLKDRYSKKGPLRSFIEPHQSDRVEINRWIIPIREIIEGMHVVVIDDSLVRGTSSRAIIKALKRAGARKISMLITYPPIRFPCYAGIDFPSREELAAFDDGKGLSDEAVIAKVRSDIGADFLGYNDAENLAAAVGIPADSMCFSCVSGDYSSLGITPEFGAGARQKKL